MFDSSSLVIGNQEWSFSADVLTTKLSSFTNIKADWMTLGREVFYYLCEMEVFWNCVLSFVIIQSLCSFMRDFNCFELSSFCNFQKFAHYFFNNNFLLKLILCVFVVKTILLLIFLTVFCIFSKSFRLCGIHVKKRLFLFCFLLDVIQTRGNIIKKIPFTKPWRKMHFLQIPYQYWTL